MRRRKRRKRRLKRAVRSLLLFSVMVLLTVEACFLIPRVMGAGEQDSPPSVAGQTLAVGAPGVAEPEEAEEGIAEPEGINGGRPEPEEAEEGSAEPVDGAGTTPGGNRQISGAEEFLKQMTLEQKVLQLFVITPETLNGFSGTVTAAGEATRKSILKYPVGGLVYFAGNLKNPDQVRSMLENTLLYYEEAGYPMPFLAVDEEGGTVARIAGQRAFGVEQVGDMWDIGKGGDVKEAERAGTVIGAYLAELGFNLDFAPDADVLTNPDNKVIGRRSFGSDGELVAEMALAQLRGLESCGVYGTLKHYPGHGATSGDTHAGYAGTDRTLEELMGEELVPFAEGARTGVSFIMVSHIAVPSVTGDDTPCTLSRYMITDILRKKLGYEGIVITDAMNMGAISKRYGAAEAAAGALQAGADMILMPADFEKAYKGVLAAVETGELTEERIEESVRRILRLKYGESEAGFQEGSDKEAGGVLFH